MRRDRTLRWLQWAMVLLGGLLTLVTLANASLEPVPSPLVGVVQWLAVGAATAMLAVATAMLRSETALSDWAVNPAPTIAVFGGTAGLLAAVSTTDVPDAVLLGATIAGVAGVVGGLLVFLAGWRSV